MDVVYAFYLVTIIIVDASGIESERFSRQNNNRVSSTCVVPPVSADKSIAIFDSNDKPISAQAGSRVPKTSYAKIRCASGYSLPDGSSSYNSYCWPKQKGEWDPPIQPCLRVCPRLRPANVYLTCKRNRQEVSCDSMLLSGTEVKPSCKELHHPSPDFSSGDTALKCQNDGRWDKALLKCIPNCGEPIHTTLIADGTKAKPGQFPWHVAIYYIPLSHTLICSGTLITTNIVISAAHCFYDEGKGKPKKNPNDYAIVVGKITRNFFMTDNKVVQKTMEVTEILFADKPYNPAVSSYSSDIAIIKLKTSITISQFVLPACFQNNDHNGFNPGKGTMGVLAGWGIDESGKPSDELKTAMLPYIQYKECATKITGVTIDKFCAGSNKGPKPGKGDSGGGLVFRDPYTNLYALRGVVSTAEKYSQAAVTTFTDISYYDDWIDRIIREESGKNPNNGPSTTQSSTGTNSAQPDPWGPQPDVSSAQPDPWGQQSGLSSNGQPDPWGQQSGLSSNGQPDPWGQQPDMSSSSQPDPWGQQSGSGMSPNGQPDPWGQQPGMSSNGQPDPWGQQPDTSSSSAQPDPWGEQPGMSTNGQPDPWGHQPDTSSTQPDPWGPHPTTTQKPATQKPPQKGFSCGIPKIKHKDANAQRGRAMRGAWPWIAALYYQQSGSSKLVVRCAGVLISDQWVLTVSHCLIDRSDLKLVQVRLGDTDLDSTSDDASRVDIVIDMFMKYPTYSTSPIVNDIALLRLSKRVMFNDYISPICLPTSASMSSNLMHYDRKKPKVTGWGRTTTKGSPYSQLWEMEVNTIPNSKCTESYVELIQRNEVAVDDRVICGMRPGMKDTCLGSSGSPLMFEQQGVWYLGGIKSFSYECGLEYYPGIYTKIVEFIDWINTSTGLKMPEPW